MSRDEGLFTPQDDDEEEEDEEEESYFFQRGSTAGARSQEDETAVREFLIATVALPDTVAIMVAECWEHVVAAVAVCRE